MKNIIRSLLAGWLSLSTAALPAMSQVATGSSKIVVGAGVSWDGSNNINGSSTNGGNINMSSVGLTNYGGSITLKRRRRNASCSRA